MEFLYPKLFMLPWYYCAIFLLRCLFSSSTIYYFKCSFSLLCKVLISKYHPIFASLETVSTSVVYRSLLIFLSQHKSPTKKHIQLFHTLAFYLLHRMSSDNLGRPHSPLWASCIEISKEAFRNLVVSILPSS